nr:hypothetical protein pHum4b_000331 [Escherichia coli]
MVPEATSEALCIFYDVVTPYEPYGDLTMTHSLQFLPATDTAHPRFPSLLTDSFLRQWAIV